MVTGASTADLALILVDVRHGMTEQSRRHTAIAKLLGIRHVVVCVNKMDLVGYAEERVRRGRARGARVVGAARPARHRVHPDLRAARRQRRRARRRACRGTAASRCSSHLESRAARPASRRRRRLPVQYVIRAERRLYAGQVAAGALRVGDEVAVLPGRRALARRGDRGPAGPLDEAPAPLSVAVALEDELDVSRGDLIAPVDARARAGRASWPRRSAGSATPRRARAVATCSSTRPAPCARSSTGSTTGSTWRRSTAHPPVRWRSTTSPASAAPGRAAGRRSYAASRATGAFILIDEATNDTVAAGMVEG